MIKAKKIAVCFVAAVLGWGSPCFAQELKPAQKATVRNASRIDLFAGYSYWAPHASVNGFRYKSDNQGMIFSGTYFFNRYVGGQVEGERAQQTSNDGMQAFSAGPFLRYPIGQSFTPVAHCLVGTAGVTGPNVPTINSSSFYFNPERWGAIVTVGGGINYASPLLHQHVRIRLFQADYQYAHVDFGPVQATTGGRSNINAVRLSVGIAYNIGSITSPVQWRFLPR